MRLGVLPLLAALLLGLTRCAPPLLVHGAADMPPLQLNVVGQPPVRDGRARFRTLFCQAVASQGPTGLDCERLLLRLADEPAATTPAPAPAHDPRLHILLVPGGFAQCFKDAELLPEALPRLRALGYPVSTVPISGRSSSAYNSRRIARAVARLELPPEGRLVLVGYSKGVVDILEFLTQYPRLAARVHAVVSISGSVNGSPVATRYGSLYRATEDWLLRRCSPGDKGVSVDLERERRMTWLAKHRLPSHIRSFSLASIVPPGELARGLTHIGASLRHVDPLNDGQLLFYDQLVPGSELLGYVGADHWAAALPLQERWYLLAGNPAGTHFPRDLLLEAILLRVSEALGGAP